MYQLQTTMNIVAPNGTVLGELYQEVDGYHVFAFVENTGGYIESDFFRFVADTLDELNQDYAKQQQAKKFDKAIEKVKELEMVYLQGEAKPCVLGRTPQQQEIDLPDPGISIK